MRYVGESKYLYLGRGSGYEGLWQSPIRVESFLRKRDKFLEYIRKHLSSTMIKSISMDELDRIFSIDYAKWGRINKFCVFYNARNLYFSNHFYDPNLGKMRLFKSWTMKTQDCEDFSFSMFDEVGRNNLDKSQEPIDVVSMQSLLAKEKRLAMVGNSGGKSKKFFNRKRKRIIEDLNKVMVIPKLIQITDMENIEDLPLKNNIDGVKLNFREKEHYKRRDEVYTKIKKLKKAKGILDLRLKDTDLSLANFKDVVEVNNLKPINPVWRTEKNKQEPTITTEKSYKLFINEEFKMGIGISAIGNDQLRSEWAKKTDFWFHLDGDRSPHIILKITNNVLSQDALILVASAMSEFSQFNYGEVNLVYTQVKNLKGVKGSAGKVIFKKEKRIRVQVNSNWRDIFI